ncbi:MAG: DUF373 family protein, partial [Acidilobaceae archaeon]|nr:DUF373 family protein [Acidilobaceae archaeon]
SYTLVIRYARKALGDPRFSKYTLGIPGIMIFVLALFSMFGLLLEALSFMLLLLGMAMIAKGFGLERHISTAAGKFAESVKEMPHMKLAGLIIAIALLASGLSITYHAFVNEGLYGALSRSLSAGIPLILLGAALYVLVSYALQALVMWSSRLFNHLAVIVVLLFSAAAFHDLGARFAASLSAGEVGAAEALYRATLDSNFIPLVVVGASLAMLFEVISRVKRG